MKVILQSAIVFSLINGIQASSDVVEQVVEAEQSSIAFVNLRRAVVSGPFAIEPMTVTEELRGFTFSGFDETLYKFFEKKEFKVGEPYHLLDYACGTGRWSATAAVQSEMDKRKVSYIARDPYMQAEHAEYYNNAWSTYVRENGSACSTLNVGQGWLSEIAAENSMINAVLVRDSIHLFTEEHIAELFQIGARITPDDGSIIVHATPAFATMFWNPKVRFFLLSNGLTSPNFGEIFFNEGRYKAYGRYTSSKMPGLLGRLNEKSVCLPAIRNIAEQHGWWLQAIQVGKTLMTHTKPLTEKQLYEFIQSEIMKLSPKPEEYNMEFKPYDPPTFLRFKKSAILPSAEGK
jgi:hypothetical protein